MNPQSQPVTPAGKQGCAEGQWCPALVAGPLWPCHTDAAIAQFDQGPRLSHTVC